MPDPATFRLIFRLGRDFDEALRRELDRHIRTLFGFVTAATSGEREFRSRGRPHLFYRMEREHVLVEVSGSGLDLSALKSYNRLPPGVIGMTMRQVAGRGPTEPARYRARLRVSGGHARRSEADSDGNPES